MYKQILGCSLLFLVGYCCYAQETPDSDKLKEVIFSQRRIKKVAGGNETQLDTLFIEKKIQQDLSELLSENSPVFIKTYGRGSPATISFRGTAPTHTQVLWNGLRINSPAMGVADFSLIPAFLLDEVTLYHGAASLLTNAGSIGGSVILESAPRWRKKEETTYIQGVGSYRTFDSMFSIQRANDRWLSRTRLYYQRSENDFRFKNRDILEFRKDGDTPAGYVGEPYHPTQTNINGDYMRWGFLQELYYRPTVDQWLSLQVWGNEMKRGIPPLATDESGENILLARQDERHIKAVFSWKKTTKASDWTLRTGVDDQKYVFLEEGRGARNLLSRYYFSNAQHYFVQGELGHTLNPTTRLKLQLRWNADVMQTHAESKVDVFENLIETWRQEGGVLTSLEKTLFKGFSTHMMVRQGWVGKGYYGSPYLGMEYQLDEALDWKVKFNASHLIKYPTLSNLYHVPGGNSDLKPEKSLTFESGTSFRQNWWNIQNEFEVTAYKTNAKDWIIWLPTFSGYWTAENIRRIDSYGVEAEWKAKKQTPLYTLRSIAHFTWSRSLNYGERKTWGDESIGKQLVYIPEFSGNWNGHFAYKGYYLSYTFNYYSERYTTTDQEKSSKRDRLSPYFMNDLAIGKEQIPIGKRVKLDAQFKIYNLFNEEYRTVLRRPMPRRNFYLTLTLNI